ncbi:hypothetical protein HDU76_000695 [Blyttiomyces sp. JEL0837]|nr:hypothetical protein HDU76_000695 [Blyttiomyces sp. JEL0837]
MDELDVGLENDSDSDDDMRFIAGSHSQRTNHMQHNSHIHSHSHNRRPFSWLACSLSVLMALIVSLPIEVTADINAPKPSTSIAGVPAGIPTTTTSTVVAAVAADHDQSVESLLALQDLVTSKLADTHTNSQAGQESIASTTTTTISYSGAGAVEGGFVVVSTVDDDDDEPPLNPFAAPSKGDDAGAGSTTSHNLFNHPMLLEQEDLSAGPGGFILLLIPMIVWGSYYVKCPNSPSKPHKSVRYPPASLRLSERSGNQGQENNAQNQSSSQSSPPPSGLPPSPRLNQQQAPHSVNSGHGQSAPGAIPSSGLNPTASSASSSATAAASNNLNHRQHYTQHSQQHPNVYVTTGSSSKLHGRGSSHHRNQGNNANATPPPTSPTMTSSSSLASPSPVSPSSLFSELPAPIIQTSTHGRHHRGLSHMNSMSSSSGMSSSGGGGHHQNHHHQHQQHHHHHSSRPSSSSRSRSPLPHGPQSQSQSQTQSRTRGSNNLVTTSHQHTANRRRSQHQLSSSSRNPSRDPSVIEGDSESGSSEYEDGDDESNRNGDGDGEGSYDDEIAVERRDYFSSDHYPQQQRQQSQQLTQQLPQQQQQQVLIQGRKVGNGIGNGNGSNNGGGGQSRQVVVNSRNDNGSYPTRTSSSSSSNNIGGNGYPNTPNSVANNGGMMAVSPGSSNGNGASSGYFTPGGHGYNNMNMELGDVNPQSGNQGMVSSNGNGSGATTPGPRNAKLTSIFQKMIGGGRSKGSNSGPGANAGNVSGADTHDEGSDVQTGGGGTGRDSMTEVSLNQQQNDGRNGGETGKSSGKSSGKSRGGRGNGKSEGGHVTDSSSAASDADVVATTGPTTSASRSRFWLRKASSSSANIPPTSHSEDNVAVASVSSFSNGVGGNGEFVDSATLNGADGSGGNSKLSSRRRAFLSVGKLEMPPLPTSSSSPINISSSSNNTNALVLNSAITNPNVPGTPISPQNSPVMRFWPLRGNSTNASSGTVTNLKVVTPPAIMLDSVDYVNVGVVESRGGNTRSRPTSWALSDSENLNDGVNSGGGSSKQPSISNESVESTEQRKGGMVSSITAVIGNVSGKGSGKGDGGSSSKKKKEKEREREKAAAAAAAEAQLQAQIGQGQGQPSQRSSLSRFWPIRSSHATAGVAPIGDDLDESKENTNAEGGIHAVSDGEGEVMTRKLSSRSTSRGFWPARRMSNGQSYAAIVASGSFEGADGTTTTTTALQHQQQNSAFLGPDTGGASEFHYHHSLQSGRVSVSDSGSRRNSRTSASDDAHSLAMSQTLTTVTVEHVEVVATANSTTTTTTTNRKSLSSFVTRGKKSTKEKSASVPVVGANAGSNGALVVGSGIDNGAISPVLGPQANANVEGEPITPVPSGSIFSRWSLRSNSHAAVNTHDMATASGESDVPSSPAHTGPNPTPVKSKNWILRSMSGSTNSPAHVNEANPSAPTSTPPSYMVPLKGLSDDESADNLSGNTNADIVVPPSKPRSRSWSLKGLNLSAALSMATGGGANSANASATALDYEQVKSQASPTSTNAPGFPDEILMPLQPQGQSSNPTLNNSNATSGATTPSEKASRSRSRGRKEFATVSIPMSSNSAVVNNASNATATEGKQRFWSLRGTSSSSASSNRQHDTENSPAAQQLQVYLDAQAQNAAEPTTSTSTPMEGVESASIDEKMLVPGKPGDLANASDIENENDGGQQDQVMGENNAGQGEVPSEGQVPPVKKKSRRRRDRKSKEKRRRAEAAALLAQAALEADGASFDYSLSERDMAQMSLEHDMADQIRHPPNQMPYYPYRTPPSPLMTDGSSVFMRDEHDYPHEYEQMDGWGRSSYYPSAMPPGSARRTSILQTDRVREMGATRRSADTRSINSFPEQYRYREMAPREYALEPAYVQQQQQQLHQQHHHHQQYQQLQQQPQHRGVMGGGYGGHMSMPMGGLVGGVPPIVQTPVSHVDSFDYDEPRRSFEDSIRSDRSDFEDGPSRASVAESVRSWMSSSSVSSREPSIASASTNSRFRDSRGRMSAGPPSAGVAVGSSGHYYSPRAVSPLPPTSTAVPSRGQRNRRLSDASSTDGNLRANGGVWSPDGWSAMIPPPIGGVPPPSLTNQPTHPSQQYHQHHQHHHHHNPLQQGINASAVGLASSLQTPPASPRLRFTPASAAPGSPLMSPRVRHAPSVSSFGSVGSGSATGTVLESESYPGSISSEIVRSHGNLHSSSRSLRSTGTSESAVDGLYSPFFSGLEISLNQKNNGVVSRRDVDKSSIHHYHHHHHHHHYHHYHHSQSSSSTGESATMIEGAISGFGGSNAVGAIGMGIAGVAGLPSSGPVPNANGAVGSGVTSHSNATTASSNGVIGSGVGIPSIMISPAPSPQDPDSLSPSESNPKTTTTTTTTRSSMRTSTSTSAVFTATSTVATMTQSHTVMAPGVVDEVMMKSKPSRGHLLSGHLLSPDDTSKGTGTVTTTATSTSTNSLSAGGLWMTMQTRALSVSSSVSSMVSFKPSEGLSPNVFGPQQYLEARMPGGAIWLDLEEEEERRRQEQLQQQQQSSAKVEEIVDEDVMEEVEKEMEKGGEGLVGLGMSMLEKKGESKDDVEEDQKLNEGPIADANFSLFDKGLWG